MSAMSIGGSSAPPSEEELREARVRSARRRDGWREITGVRRVGPRLCAAVPDDGTRLIPFTGETFDRAVPLLFTPELCFVVGADNSIAFYEVLRAASL